MCRRDPRGSQACWLQPRRRLPAEPCSDKTRLAGGFLAGLLWSKQCLKWGFSLCYCPLKAGIQL